MQKDMGQTKKLWMGFLLGLGCLPVTSHDFTVTRNGQKLYFNITSKVEATAEVTYKGSIGSHPVCDMEGIIEIPAQVRHNNVVYNITAIGSKAFSGARGLTGIVLPASIKKIGDFAFEGCSCLSQVVFPGNTVMLGQGTFFKCKSLKEISFGSDWKVLDLTPYRWSDSLRVIALPAKVEKVQNLKMLSSLQRVEVDANNPKFSSVDGVLYSKDGKTLYGVPCDYQGMLKVKAGTKTITHGALSGCLGITAVVFPESLQAFSFRETSRMASLAEIVFKAKEPVVTAYKDGQGIFLLQVTNQDVKIIVPKEAKKLFARRLVVAQGEYSETVTGVSYQVGKNELPIAKNIKGVKNIWDL